MAEYYYAQGGTAADKESATSGTYPTGCMSPATAVSESSGFSADDFCLASDEGGVIRATILPGSNGSDGSPITWGAKIGDTPEISAANHIETWTSEGSDHYSADLTTDPIQAFMDDTRLTEGSAKDTLNDHEWFWEANKLYVRDDSGDPDVTGVVIEASIRDCCIDVVNGRSYLTFENLTLEKAADTNADIYHDGSKIEHIIFDNVDNHRAYFQGMRVRNQSTLSNNFTYKNSEVSYCGGSGLQTYKWNISLIANNNVHHNCQLDTVDPGFHGLTAGIKMVNVSNANCVIEYNWVHNNGNNWLYSDARGTGIWSDADPTGQIFRYNLVHENDSCGLHFEGGSNNGKMYGNVSYKNGHTGIKLTSTGSSIVHSNEVYNNTVVANEQHGIVVGGVNAQADSSYDNVVRNNICVGNATVGGRQMKCFYGGENDGTMGHGNVYNNNCFGEEYTGFLEWGDGSAYNTYVAWLAASSQIDNNIEADPLFTDADNDDYTLASGSPCIGVGVDLGSPYNIALLPGSTWPDSVLTGDQEAY